jgi:hypothetical protein
MWHVTVFVGLDNHQAFLQRCVLEKKGTMFLRG